MNMLLSDLKSPKHVKYRVLHRPNFKALVEHMRKNGQLARIYVVDGVIIDGIARYLAALELGWEEIEVS